MTGLKALAAMVPEATQRLQHVARKTPLELNERLSAATGSSVWLKREDLQPVRSYKLRGAYNLIAQLSEAERQMGVICASAGNHGQGVAWSCAHLGIRGRIYVPTTTPRQKLARMERLGQGMIELIAEGQTYDQASAAAEKAAKETGAVKVSAFDDPRTAAGQGTMIIEIIEQLGRAPDVLLVPVGGGGLLAGCASWLRVHHPKTRIIGVEPEGAPCMAAAISAGRVVTLPSIDTFVDGAAVSRAGDFTFGIAREAQVELTRIPEGQICTEMLAMYQVDGIIAEPAGALASAALPTGQPGTRVHIAPGSTVVAILTGGNNDVSRYADIVERSLVHEGRKHYFLVEFPQEPGSLRTFLDTVLGPYDDITFFEYIKRSNRETGPALVGVELHNAGDYPFLMNRIAESGMEVEVIRSDSPYFRFLV